VTECVGAGDSAGLSVSLRLETPPGAAEPDRLAIQVRIPLAMIGQLTAAAADRPPGEPPPACPPAAG